MLVPLRLRGRHEHGFFKAVAERRGPGADAAARLHESYGLRKDGSEFPVTINLGDWVRHGEIMFSAEIKRR